MSYGEEKLKPHEVVVRQIQAQDQKFFSEAVDILNRTQGRGLFPDEYLNERVQKPTSFIVGAFLKEELVGVAIAEVISGFEYYSPFDPSLSAELQNKKVGSFSTMSVVEKLQGRGVGQELSLSRLAWLKSVGCEVVLGVSWVSGKPHTSKRVFEKLGFKQVNKVDHFYYESGLKKPFFCPGCEVQPCVCAAILYRLDL